MKRWRAVLWVSVVVTLGFSALAQNDDENPASTHRAAIDRAELSETTGANSPDDNTGSGGVKSGEIDDHPPVARGSSPRALEHPTSLEVPPGRKEYAASPDEFSLPTRISVLASMIVPTLVFLLWGAWRSYQAWSSFNAQYCWYMGTEEFDQNTPRALYFERLFCLLLGGWGPPVLGYVLCASLCSWAMLSEHGEFWRMMWDTMWWYLLLMSVAAALWGLGAIIAQRRLPDFEQFRRACAPMVSPKYPDAVIIIHEVRGLILPSGGASDETLRN